jgi:HD-like signal output (HDOD) protein
MPDLSTVPALTQRDVPARAGAAARVLTITDDPEADIRELVNAVGADPALAAKILTLANSAYYGLSRRVGTLQYAIAVVGFQTVRALAVSICAGLDGPQAVPKGFWEQASCSATAAHLIAPIVGASPQDAFCAGLLHTLGSALLHQQDDLPALCLPTPDDENAFNELEIDTYGVGHAEAGARALTSWRFPEHLCYVIAGHHNVPLPDAGPLERTLHAARIVTDLCLVESPDAGRAESMLMRLTDGDLTAGRIESLMVKVRTQSEHLQAGLEA